MAKKKGGIGMHTTAVTTREFRANLHKVRVKTDKGSARKTVCAACIKHGKVTKA
jgi:ribosomal protein L28